MKNKLKIFFALLSVLAIVFALGIFAFAEEGDLPEGEIPEGGTEEQPEEETPITEDRPLVEGAIYEIRNKDGFRSGSGATASALKEALAASVDGDTVTLLANVETEYLYDEEGNIIILDYESGLQATVNGFLVTTESEDEEKTVNFDFNGYAFQIFTWNATAISVDGNATLNIYSSRPGANLFMGLTVPSKGASYCYAGAALAAGGTATLNVGRFVDKDGTVYPGSNLTATAGAIFSIGSGSATINVDGGSYYRPNTQSMVGTIIQRAASEGLIYIKNANILSYGAGQMITIPGEKSTTILENCLIYNTNVTDQKHHALVANRSDGNVNFHFYGKLILRDCVTSYNLVLPENRHVSEGSQEVTGGRLWLEGENVFRDEDIVNIEFIKAMREWLDCYVVREVDGETVYEPVLKGIEEEGYVQARVGNRYEIKTNGSAPLFVPTTMDGIYGPDDYSLDVIPFEVIPFTNGITYVRLEDAVEIIFETDEQSISDIWKRGETNITAPRLLRLPADAVEGLYSYKWKFSAEVDGKVYASYARVAEFDVRVFYDISDTLTLNVCIPQEIFEEKLDVINAMLDGKYIKAGTEKSITITVDGEERSYKAFVVSGIALEDAMNTVEIKLPLDFYNPDTQKTVTVEGDFSIDFASYLESVKQSFTGGEYDQLVNDAAYYVGVAFKSRVADYESNENYARICSLVNSDSVMATSELFITQINTVKGFAKYSSDVLALSASNSARTVTFAIKEGFTGTLKVYLAGGMNTYKIENGKYDGSSSIVIQLAESQIFEKISIKAYGADNLQLNAGSDGYSGSYTVLADVNTQDALYMAYLAVVYGAVSTQN